MGTRADFYIGRGEGATWIGSLAWDGYPSGLTPLGEKLGSFGGYVHEKWPDDEHLFDSRDEAEFRARVERLFVRRDDATLPAMGWPWPWTTSATTDYAYALDDGRVWASCFGGPWFDPRQPQPDGDDETGEPAVFPDMSAIQKTTFGQRSGVMFI